MIDLEEYKRDLKAGKYDNYAELYDELVLDYSRLFEGLKNAGAELFDLRKDYAKLLQDNTRLLELLREGIEPLNSAQWKIWVEKVEKELGDED